MAYASVLIAVLLSGCTVHMAAAAPADVLGSIPFEVNPDVTGPRNL